VRTSIVAVCFGSALVLTGCAATEGVLGGGYQREIDRKEGEIAELSREQSELVTRLDKVQRRREDTQREGDELSQRLTGLQSSLRRSQVRIQSQQFRKKLDKATLDRLSAEQRRLDLVFSAMLLRAEEGRKAVSSGTAEPPELKADLSSLEQQLKSHEVLLNRYLDGN
jgi:chromosome segregation ATPase